jgi:hypothetical protein
VFLLLAPLGARVRRWGVAAIALTMFILAALQPWIRLHIPTDPVAELVGGPQRYEIRMYGFTQLQDTTAGIVADWAILVALFVLSWRVPRWRRPLAIAAGVVVVLLLVVTVNLGRTLADSLAPGRDLPYDALPAYARTDYLRGAWFSVIGAVELLGVIALPEPNRRNAPPEHYQPEDDTTAAVA